MDLNAFCLEVLAGVAGGTVEEITAGLDGTLEALGIDSMGAVELLARVEAHCGVVIQLGPEALRGSTVRQLLHTIADNVYASDIAGGEET